ncbi:MAG: hypothetical protein JRI68_18250 [Deltaproteobacteria bacterium]|nr:hypothetical protein [Deltaproteobacteria bacterium]
MGSSRERPGVEPHAAAAQAGDGGRAAEADPELTAWRDRVDLEALLVALVLVPHSYPRNRFFDLFRWPDARDVRRRAALLRSVIADLATGEAAGVAADLRGASVVLRYHLPEFGLYRTTRLGRDELALIKLALQRSDGGARDPGRPGRAAALAPLRQWVDDREVARLVAKLERLFTTEGATQG